MTLSEISTANLEGESVENATTQVMPAPHRSRSRSLRFHPALIVVAGACAALFHQVMRSGLSGDVFYQLAEGQWMLAHHTVIRHDVFSYTVAGRPWLSEEWGFALLLAWSVNHIGAAVILACLGRRLDRCPRCSASSAGGNLEPAGCGRRRFRCSPEQVFTLGLPPVRRTSAISFSPCSCCC